MSESFGARIRRLRLAAEMTQQRLAYRAGVTVQTVSRAEKDRHAPSPPIRNALARALGVTPGYLEHGVETLASDTTAASEEIRQVFAGLSEHGRRAALDHLRIVRELEQAYRTDEPRPLFAPLPGEPSAAMHNEAGEIVTEDNAPGSEDEE